MTVEQIATELATYLSASQVATLIDASESEPDPTAWLAARLDDCRHNRLHLLL